MGMGRGLERPYFSLATSQVAMLQTVTLKMDVSMLQCSFCSQPLKPPVFKGGHLAWGHCASELPGNQCQKCKHPSGRFDHESAMDTVVSAAMVKCPHRGYESFVAYHEVHDHEIVCLHASCSCTESGCDFVAPPGALVLHLTAAHSIQVHRLQYSINKAFQEPVPVPSLPCWWLILTGEDGVVFILTIKELGPATIGSSVCVRSTACVWPLYTVRMWATGPTASSLADYKSRTETMMVDVEASSSASLGDIVFEELTSFLGVPLRYLIGAGTSKQLRFYIRIEKQNSSKI